MKNEIEIEESNPIRGIYGRFRNQHFDIRLPPLITFRSHSIMIELFFLFFSFSTRSMFITVLSKPEKAAGGNNGDGTRPGALLVLSRTM